MNISEGSAYLSRELLDEATRARVQYEGLEARRRVMSPLNHRRWDDLCDECEAAYSAWKDLERRAEAAREVA